MIVPKWQLYVKSDNLAKIISTKSSNKISLILKE